MAVRSLPVLLYGIACRKAALLAPKELNKKTKPPRPCREQQGRACLGASSKEKTVLGEFTSGRRL